MDSDYERRIRERAYEIWVREGRPHGRDAEHWQRAEAEISSESGIAADRAAARSKPRSEAPPAAAPLHSRAAPRIVNGPPSGTPAPQTVGDAASGSRRGRKSAEP